MVFSNNLLMGAGGQATGYEIEQSIRFNDDDSARLARDGFGQSPTSSTVCTISVWVKRGNNLGSNSTIIYGGDPSGSTAESLRFGTGNQLQFSQASSDYDLKTSQIFVDPAAWYHIVAVLNTGAAESSRAALYVNGSKVTDFATENYPGSSYSTNFTANSSSVEHVIGANSDSGPASQFFDGYIAEFNFIDGQALTPSSFGETDSTTGQWVPKKYTGSYGNNGFFIDGRDSSDLGDDESGNGNDLTASGLTSADQVSDSPTNNFCVLSPIDEFGGGLTLSDGNLRAVPSASTYCNNHGTFYINSGKWVFECKHTTVFGEACGWSPPQELISGSSDRGYFMMADGRAYDNTTNTGTKGASLASGDFRYVFYDADAQAMWFAHVDVSSSNALVYDNSATKAEIEAGTTTNAVFTSIPAGLWAPGIWMDTSGVIEVNFGQSSFATTSDLPSGFNTLCAANLPDPTIADPSAYFQPTLYTGNGSTQEVNQAGNSTFEPGFVWIKTRSNAASHALFDQVRGVNKQLRSDSSGAEYTSYSDLLTSFDADGFTLGADATVNNVNVNTYTYAAWQWAADGTSGSSNEDGSITSTVSANTTSGFSIVSYTGTGANATVGHGLGVAPQMIIIKNRPDADSWVVYHEDIGATKGLTLDTTAAATTASTFFNNTAPTSSVFSIGSGGRTNGSSDAMIAYCFANIEGYSKFGEYEGNGSTDGPFIYTGFKPRWIMIKRYNTTESWPILDTARGSGNFGSDAGTSGNNPTAGNDLNAVLVGSTSAAEEDNPTGSRRASFLSNGFKVKTTNTAMNASGSDYIYMAFAESPFKTATAR